jgi:hypothetical protein
MLLIFPLILFLFLASFSDFSLNNPQALSHSFGISKSLLLLQHIEETDKKI